MELCDTFILTDIYFLMILLMGLYTKPILALRYCHCLCLAVCLYVQLCINQEFVHTITCDLLTPNFIMFFFLKGWMTHLHLGGVWVVEVCMWGVGGGGWGAPPYWSKQTKGISVLNSDFIRWPIQLWKPTHLYYQNKFNKSLHLNARVVSTHWGHVKMDAIF